MHIKDISNGAYVDLVPSKSQSPLAETAKPA